MNERKIGLDSLRGMAITLIVMSHCGILAQGGLGNAIFFTLSGFLAMMPFNELGERKFLTPINIGKYYLGRFVRIMPVLWVVLLLVWLLFPYNFFSITDIESFSSLVLNMFLYKAKNHLWFLQQEMVFYLVLPLIMLLICFLSKCLSKITSSSELKHCIISLMMFFVAIIYHKYRSTDIFYLWGNWEKQYFRLDQFLVGGSIAYIYKAICDNKEIQKYKVYKIICIIYSICFLMFCIFSSNYFLGRYDIKYADFLIGWDKPMLCGALTGGFILAILTCDRNLFHDFFENKLFVYLGKLSFVIYLTHWFFIPLFEQRGLIRSFLFVYIVTIGFSIILHVLFEKPAIILAKTLKINEVKRYYKNLGSNFASDAERKR